MTAKKNNRENFRTITIPVKTYELLRNASYTRRKPMRTMAAEAVDIYLEVTNDNWEQPQGEKHEQGRD